MITTTIMTTTRYDQKSKAFFAFLLTPNFFYSELLADSFSSSLVTGMRPRKGPYYEITILFPGYGFYIPLPFFKVGKNERRKCTRISHLLPLYVVVMIKVRWDYEDTKGTRGLFRQGVHICMACHLW